MNSKKKKEVIPGTGIDQKFFKELKGFIKENSPVKRVTWDDEEVEEYIKMVWDELSVLLSKNIAEIIFYGTAMFAYRAVALNSLKPEFEQRAKQFEKRYNIELSKFEN
jgi:hypothetical protein